MRNAKVITLVLLSLVTVIGCRKEETPSARPETQTTSAPLTGTTSTAVPSVSRGRTASAAVQVDIRLIGLCTIADQSITPGESALKTIVLANHSNSKPHPHKAMFLVPYNNIANPPGPFRKVGIEGGIEYWGYDLTGIQLVPDYVGSNYGDTGPVRFSDAGEKTNDRLPELAVGKQNLNSLHWIPSMSRVVGGSASPKMEYFKKEPVDSNVLARMALPGGDLQSKLYDPYWVWQFGNFKQVQVAADEIHYTFALKDSHQPYTMYGRKFVPTGTPGPPAELFKLKVANDGDAYIPVYLANIVEENFGKSVTLQPGYKDPHFELHYELLNDNPPRFAPVIVTSMVKNSRVSSPAGAGLYCGPDGMP